MPNQETMISGDYILPKRLYHLVPKNIYDKYTDSNKNYDCRNTSEWGHNSNFIHTATTLKILAERVFKGKGIEFPADVEFIILIIDTKKIKSKFSFAEFNGTRYFHIWGSIPKEAYKIKEVRRAKNGDFIF